MTPAEHEFIAAVQEVKKICNEAEFANALTLFVARITADERRKERLALIEMCGTVKASFEKRGMIDGAMVANELANMLIERGCK